jgi:hypothetical protein
MVRRSVLLQRRVDNAQVEANLPVKRRKIVGFIQANQRCDQLFPTVETHSDVAPQRTRMVEFAGRYSDAKFYFYLYY